MKRAAIALPVVLSVALVSVATAAGSVVPSPAPRAQPCASPSAVLASPCHPAEKSPPATPADRCDPFRSPCAISCRLVGWHQNGVSVAGLTAAVLSWDEGRARPLHRASNTPEPVPRFDGFA